MLTAMMIAENPKLNRAGGDNGTLTQGDMVKSNALPEPSSALQEFGKTRKR